MKHTVLIIDDEVDECLLIAGYLRNKDCHVEYAHTLEEGIEKLRTFHPESLLLDNNLPDGRGWSYAGLIKGLFPEMRITLITAGDPSEKERHNSCAQFRHITKPMHLADLTSCLST